MDDSHLNGKFDRPLDSTGVVPQPLGNFSEGNHIQPLKQLFLIIWRRLWTILLVAVVLVGAALAVSLVQTPKYEASIKLLVGQERGITENPAAVTGLQQLTQTMAEAVKSRPVADTVIQQQDLQMTSEEFIEDHLSVNQINGTQLIEIKYEDSSPFRAQQGADAIGEVFARQISEESQNAEAVAVTVWEQAEAPNRPVTPNLLLNIGLALIVGLILGVGLALLLEYLDDSWTSPEEAERVSGVPTFGIVPQFSNSKEQTSKGST